MNGTDPSGFDIWQPQDSFTLLAMAVACAALVLAAHLALRLREVHAERKQDDKDRDKLADRLRDIEGRLRRSRWEVASLQGYQQTAEQHIDLNRPAYVPEVPSTAPAWTHTDDDTESYPWDGSHLLALGEDDTIVMEVAS